MRSTHTKPLTKPKYRGLSHQIAFFMALVASGFLVNKASSHASFLASLVYSFGLLFLFGVSAVYHRIHWQPRQRAFLKRVDHSAIFIFIAGTVTPISMFSLPPAEGTELLKIMWAVAALGIVQSIFWTKAPKWCTAIFYVGMGWIAVPYVRDLGSQLGINNFRLILAGGLAYTLGAVCYASRRPRLRPEIFGYHEVFHILVIIAAGLHFKVQWDLIR